eukprot:m.161338 g.161338  ORF g.161338 m.161338 type:complete len:59 (+) comp38815_c0_seq6:709-885(+)
MINLEEAHLREIIYHVTLKGYSQPPIGIYKQNDVISMSFHFERVKPTHQIFTKRGCSI